MVAVPPLTYDRAVPPGDTKLYRSPFLRDFIHLNVAMMTSNNALTPDADKDDILASKALDWPVSANVPRGMMCAECSAPQWLYNGLRMNGWGDNQIKCELQCGEACTAAADTCPSRRLSVSSILAARSKAAY